MENTATKRIVKARNEKGDKWDPVKIYVVFEGDTEETYLRDFFDDEIYVNPKDLIGMTEDEAREYIVKLDVEYLRS